MIYGLLFECPSGKDVRSRSLSVTGLHQTGGSDQQLTVRGEGQTTEKRAQRIVVEYSRGFGLAAFGCCLWRVLGRHLEYVVNTVLGSQIEDTQRPENTRKNQFSLSFCITL